MCHASARGSNRGCLCRFLSSMQRGAVATHRDRPHGPGTCCCITSAQGPSTRRAAWAGRSAATPNQPQALLAHLAMEVAYDLLPHNHVSGSGSDPVDPAGAVTATLDVKLPKPASLQPQMPQTPSQPMQRQGSTGARLVSATSDAAKAATTASSR